ncbi:MAG: pantetheine-phosphate adenylyltransferase [Planctomycetota bacterium]
MAAHLAVFPGSFDPISFGHMDVIRRGRVLFDELIVAVGMNPGKDPLFDIGERIEIAASLVDDEVSNEPDGAPVRVVGFNGLTMDFAKRQGAVALLRGIRNMSDLQSEIQQALTNREVGGLETAFVVAGQVHAYTSSSLIKQIAAMSDDLDKALGPVVPQLVIDRIRAKRAAGDGTLATIRRRLGGESE